MGLTLAESTTSLERSIDDLRIGARQFAALDYDDRISVLASIRPLVVRYAREWVAAAVAAKGIDPDSALSAEEWISGPYAVLYALNRYIRTLHDLQRDGRVSLPSGAVETRADGRVVVRVFPVSIYDKLLFSGISADTWMPPDVRAGALEQSMAAYYREPHHEQKVALVLGAGNIAAIGPLDVLYKLVADGAVCILKMNPVNDYLAPIFEKVFAPLISGAFLRIVTGGADVGSFLTGHRGVDEIHITGSAKTHDAIVYGSKTERSAPILDKPITSELGNVSPTIVVPGRWTKADLKFQAEHVVTQKMHNGGFNCIASQVLVLPQQWKLAGEFVCEIEALIARIPARPAYYPGAADRAREFTQDGAAVVHADAQTDDPAFRSEAFCNVLAVTRLPGDDAASFLSNAVRFANERLYGTLGANIIVDPRTERSLGSAFDNAISSLRYGSIGINAWTGVAFLLSESTWGAYPGHSLDDIQSGIGIVHNTFLFDRAEKTVIRAPFRPFPRSIAHGSMTLLPRPPWFVTNKNAAEIARKLLAFEYAPSMNKIPAIFLSALKG